MKPKTLGQYKSDRHIDLVSHITNVITCENNATWNDLYYVTSEGFVVVLSRKYETFYDEIIQKKNAYEPKSVVEFAIYHGLFIGLESYRAICHMYAEACEYKKNIPNTHLPSMTDMMYAVKEDYGNWSNCFAKPLPCKNFKYAKDYKDDGSIIQHSDVILEYGDVRLIRTNDYMYSVHGNNKMYLIHTVDRLGEGVNAILQDKFTNEMYNERERRLEVIKQITKSSTKELSLDTILNHADTMENCKRHDLLKYYIPTFIDEYCKNMKLKDGMVVSFPLEKCRGRLTLSGNTIVPLKVYDKAIEDFNTLGNNRYLSATAYVDTESVSDMIERFGTNDDNKYAKNEMIDNYLNNELEEGDRERISDIVGTILEIADDRIYVKIKHSEILNKVLQPDNLHNISAKMTYIVKESKRKGNSIVCEELDIIGFELTNETAGNPRYYFNVDCR